MKTECGCDECQCRDGVKDSVPADVGGLTIWHAFADEGEPVCVSDGHGRSLNLYLHEGNLIGLLVFDDEAGGLVSGLGVIPANGVVSLVGLLS